MTREMQRERVLRNEEGRGGSRPRVKGCSVRIISHSRAEIMHLDNMCQVLGELTIRERREKMRIARW
jgi:hypothetical protein